MPHSDQQAKLAYFRAYHQRNKDKRAAQGRFRRYGITQSDFDALLLAQGGRCAICKSTNHKGVGWCLDHDHRFHRTAKKRVRGVLCNDCNTMLGYSRDNPDTLRRAAQYLDIQDVA